MFNQKTPTTPTELEKAITRVLESMDGVDVTSEEYAKMVAQLDKLHKMLPPKKEAKVSNDALIAVAGNLLGIVIILGFERAHIVTSKALGFVLKSRI